MSSLNLPPFLKRRRGLFILLGLYFAGILFTLQFHEPWRDELHDLNLVLESASPEEFFRNFESSGFLWYGLLRIFHFVIPTQAVVHIISVTFSLAAIATFLFLAPFTRVEKTLFTFGVIPFYEYPVFARHYSLNMFLIFLVLYFYGRRKTGLKPLLVTFFLMANGNVHTMMLGLTLWMGWGLRFFITRKSEKKEMEPEGFLKAWILMALFLAVGILQVLPKSNGIVKVFDLKRDYLIEALPRAFFLQGSFFRDLFSGSEKWKYVSAAALWLFILGMFRRPVLGFMFLTGVTALTVFFVTVYPASLRHEGYLIFLMIAVLWIERAESRPEMRPGFWRGYSRAGTFLTSTVFLLTLIGSCYGTSIALGKEFRSPISSSRAFGKFIKEHLEYQRALLIPEPDYAAESLPYYVENPIYLPREHRFGRVVHFTRQNDPILSLGKMLEVAAKLRAAFHQPVLLLLGHPLNPEGPYEKAFSYSRVFRYSREEVEDFLKRTRHVASFSGALVDENYEVYQLI